MNSMFMDIFISCSIIFLGIVLYFKYAFFYWRRQGIPSLQPSIPFGNASDLFLAKKSVAEVVAEIYEKLKQKGIKYGGYYLLAKPVLLLIEPKLIQQITKKNFSYFCDRGTHCDEKVDPLSNHLFSIRNPKWHELRTTFTPMFSSLKLKNIVHILLKYAEEMKMLLEEPAKNGESLDMRDLADRFTTDMVASVAFGIECNSLRNPNAELIRFGRSFFEPTLRNSLVYSLSVLHPSILKFFKIPICEPKTRKYFFDIIGYTVETREKNNIERNYFLNLLIRLKNNKSIDDIDNGKPVTSINFNELASQAFIFYLAGYETSSTTLSFAAFELAQNKDIQEKLRVEIIKIINKHSGIETYEALGEMSYLDQVVHETLRKYSPVPILNRECIKDYTIPGTNTVIKKGTAVVISIWGMHRDPELFENPDLFDPERFNLERKQTIMPNTYLPFGDGPRNCLGSRLGLLQVKLGLISLVKNYEMELDPLKKIPSEFNAKCIVTAFKDDIWLKFRKIE